MANAIHPPIDFRPVDPSPTFGFGFGLSSPSPKAVGWPSLSPALANTPQFQQLASISNHPPSLRVSKRRLETETDEGTGRQPGSADDSMERSPTPERPKRAAPKRARVVKEDSESKDGKSGSRKKTEGNEGDDIDFGVLLASLPPQSLLPILTSLLDSHPSLKSAILPLIPRPTLETAIQALAQSAKKLRDAYPYSNGTSSSTFQSGSSACLGFGFGGIQPNTFGSTFGQFVSSQHHVDYSQLNQQNANGGMRDSYILSRLRPHIAEFVAACMSYIPYFSYVHSSSDSPLPTDSPHARAHPESHSLALRALHKDKFHPSETYLFLSALTSHVLSQPTLTQGSLLPLLLPRLAEEWIAWVDRVDEVVNKQGGMFGSETVKSWERGLDEFAQVKGQSESSMRNVRDRWVNKVGWLVGRVIPQAMEEV